MYITLIYSWLLYSIRFDTCRADVLYLLFTYAPANPNTIYIYIYIYNLNIIVKHIPKGT